MSEIATYLRDRTYAMPVRTSQIYKNIYNEMSYVSNENTGMGPV